MHSPIIKMIANITEKRRSSNCVQLYNYRKYLNKFISLEKYY